MKAKSNAIATLQINIVDALRQDCPLSMAECIEINVLLKTQLNARNLLNIFV